MLFKSHTLFFFSYVEHHYCWYLEEVSIKKMKENVEKVRMISIQYIYIYWGRISILLTQLYIDLSIFTDSIKLKINYIT